MIAIAAAPVLAAADSSSVLADVGRGTPPAARIEHVVGGRSVSVPLVLYGAPDARVDVKARLFQRAAALSAPAGDDVVVASGVAFSAGLRQKLTVLVPVPVVEREASFELIVFLRVHPDAAWRRAGSVPVRAYPGDLLAPLRRWSQRQPLRLRDASGALERFLTAEGIAFLELRARPLEPPDHPVVTLLVGGSDDLAVAKDRARSGEAVIVLRERAAAFPRAQLTRWGPGSVTVVDFEVLDRVSADPRAQSVFLELIRSARALVRGGEEEARHDGQELQ